MAKSKNKQYWEFVPKPVYTDQVTQDMGRFPPQALDLEEAVIGAVLLDKNAYDLASEVITTPDFFYKPAHQIIWNAIKSLADNGEPIDILTVTQRLKNQLNLEQAGGPAYIAKLTARVGSSAHIQFHAHIIAEMFMRRNIIRATQQLLSDAYNMQEDVLGILDRAQDAIYSPIEKIISVGRSDSFSVFQELFKYLEKVYSASSNLLGLPTGMPDLDKATNGWQGGHLIIVAARPGMGKTSFALSLARNAALISKMPIGFFSQEQPAQELAVKLAAIETGLSGNAIKDNSRIPKNIWALLQQVPDLYIDKSGENLLHIDDTPGLSISDLRTRAKRMVKKFGVKAILCDYLQKYSAEVGSYGNREQEINKITQGLKNISKELNIPVIALAQLSREVEKQSDKRPLLSHLRESGAIEQEADMVLFLHRPDYYNKLGEGDHTIKLKDGYEIDATGKCIVDIAKNRHGPLDELVLNFENVTTLFYQEGHRHVYIDRTAGLDAVLDDSTQEDSEDEENYKVPHKWHRGDIFKFINEERRKNDGNNTDF